VTPDVRVFDLAIYPRAAIEQAATRFAAVCAVSLTDDRHGTRATLVLPNDAGREVADEFCNLVLATAIELHLARGTAIG
jgi:hypothetical protein